MSAARRSAALGVDPPLAPYGSQLRSRNRPEPRTDERRIAKLKARTQNVDPLVDQGTFVAVNDQKIPFISFDRWDGRSVMLTPERILGEGTYGTVVQYNMTDGKSYAVKIENRWGLKENDKGEDERVQVPTELGVTEFLRNVECGQMSARVIGTTPNYAYSLLELMDGNLTGNALQTYARTYRLKPDMAAIHIVEEVRKQVVCLLNKSENRYVYTDMKVENVMFRVTPGQVEIKVGDFGSMDMDPEGQYVMTIPCLPSGEPYQKLETLQEKQQCLAFQLGMLLARLLVRENDVLEFYFFEDIEERRSKIDSLRSKLRNALPSWFGHLADLIHSEPYVRPDITRPFLEPMELGDDFMGGDMFASPEEPLGQHVELGDPYSFLD